MSKFKVGQEVRVVEGKSKDQIGMRNLPRNSIGKHYNIQQADYDARLYLLDNFYWYHESWLEAVKDNSFSSLLELYKWLLDGNKVQNMETKEVFYVENGQQVSSLRGIFAGNWRIADETSFTKYIEPKWEDTIPEHGIFCWNSDISIAWAKENNTYDLIYGKDDSGYLAHACSWRFAEPMTLEEIKKYIWECQK